MVPCSLQMDFGLIIMMDLGLHAARVKISMLKRYDFYIVYAYDNNIDSRTYMYIHTLVYLCKLFVPYCPSIVHSVVSLNIMFESERNHYFFNGEVISSLSGLPRCIMV